MNSLARSSPQSFQELVESKARRPLRWCASPLNELGYQMCSLSGVSPYNTEEISGAGIDELVLPPPPPPPTSLVPRPLYARWEKDKGLVPVVRACVEFYWNPGKIVFFGIF